MKKRWIPLLAAVALTVLTLAGATLAWLTGTQTVTNVVTMGNVDITLTEPAFVSENSDYTIDNVVPNQPIAKDPTVTNTGKNPAYVRIRLTYEGLSEEQAGQVEELLDIDAAWKKGTDGYYYYQQVLEPGANPVTLFTTLTIPDWGNEAEDTQFRVIAQAQAVQSQYFTPAKEGDTIVSWGAITFPA